MTENERVDYIVRQVMGVIFANKPISVEVVSRVAVCILVGVTMQVPEGRRRQELRKWINDEINCDRDMAEAVDLTPELERKN
jgi:hypothetical protein